MIRTLGKNGGNIIMKKTRVKKRDGSFLNLCFFGVPKDRIDDLVEFQMNNYVSYELTYRISGLPYSKEALTEYRDILKSKLSDPSTFTLVCCEEKDNKILPKIIASDSVRLIKQGEPYNNDIPPNLKTTEVKNYFRILRDWNNLFPVPDLMKKYNLDCFFDGQGTAVHRDYTGNGIVYHSMSIRRQVCQTLGVPMAGAWLTTVATEKATKRTGWEVVHETSREQLEKVLNLTLESTPSTYKYSILRA
ncbi:uncharacterized protein LOC113491853 [Trichoplusia ni]|uniref:Uncharacterized protein LOC113491853 n=1 Tax=Trichoplusia ni TaxID=7111 RepID=A0A7E5V982_TRINI|nr:uncharacterized protein LOC113491853 [Trichoplusia ni]